MPSRGRGRTGSWYADIELTLDARQSQVFLVRIVAAQAAVQEGAGRADVEWVRHVAGMVASATIALADPGATVRCLFRVMRGEIRVRVSVRRLPGLDVRKASGLARRWQRAHVPASTFTVVNDDGDVDVVSDACILLAG